MGLLRPTSQSASGSPSGQIRVQVPARLLTGRLVSLASVTSGADEMLLLPTLLVRLGEAWGCRAARICPISSAVSAAPPTAHLRVSPEQLQAQGCFLVRTDPWPLPLSGLTPPQGPAAETPLHL